MGILSKNIPRRLVLFCVLFLPVFFVPYISRSISSPDGFKVLILFIATSVVVLFYSIQVRRDRSFDWNRHNIVTATFFIVFFGLITTFLSISQKNSLYGYFYETESFFSLIVLFLFFLVTVLTFKSHKQVLQSIIVVLYAYLFLVVVEGINFLFLRTSHLFPEPTVVGTWDDLAIFSAIVLFLSSFILYSKEVNTKPLIFLYLTLGTSFSIFLLAGTVLLSTILTVILLASSLVVLYRRLRDHGAQSLNNHFLVFGVSLIVFMGLFTLSGIQPYLQGKFKEVESQQASFVETLHVAQQTIAFSPTRALFGSGQNTFTYQWNKYADDATNKDSGSSFFSQGLITTGLLGVFSWFVLFSLVLYYGVQSIRFQEDETGTLALPVFMVLGLLFFYFLFYNPSFTVLFFFFFFLGVFTVIVTGKSSEFKKEIAVTGIKRTCILFLVPVIFFGIIVQSYAAYGITRADSLFQKGALLLVSNEFESAREALKMSSDTSHKDIYYRTLARVEYEYLKDIFPTPLNSVRRLAEASVKNAETAITLNSADYQNWHMLGQIHLLLLQTGLVPGSLSRAESAYEGALVLNPNNSMINLEYAYLLFLFKRDSEQARIFAEKASQSTEFSSEARILLERIKNDK
ncbi:MAG: hypothetical protein WD509_00915 [Candidatus Paceibacterota bacterium]